MYRSADISKNPEDYLQKLCVRNGATMRASFECFYLGAHDKKMHDHLGWPSPGNIDRICQLAPTFVLPSEKHLMTNLEKIHLIEEGYNTVKISFEDSAKAANVTALGSIDPENDHIVHIKIDTNFATFSDDPVDLKFTVFVKRDDGSLVDAVFHGILSVLPGSPCPA